MPTDVISFFFFSSRNKLSDLGCTIENVPVAKVDVLGCGWCGGPASSMYFLWDY